LTKQSLERFAVSEKRRRTPVRAPSSIADTTSQLVITNHVPDSQVFNSNHAICPDQISSQLVQKIGTSIFDFGVYLGNSKSRFISVVRAFGFPTQFLLRYFKLLIQPIKMLWVGYLVAVTGSKPTVKKLVAMV
jgi:hypothetical protein